MTPYQDDGTKEGVTVAYDGDDFDARMTREMAWRKKMAEKNGVKKAAKLNRKARRKANRSPHGLRERKYDARKDSS